MTKSTIYIILILSITLLSAKWLDDKEQFVKDVEKINSSLVKAKQVYIEAEITMFQSHTSTKVLEMQKSIFAFDNGKVYSELGDVIVIGDNDYLLSIDHFEKTIAIKTSKADHSDYLEKYKVAMMTEVIEEVVLDSKDGFKEYTVKLRENGEYDKYNLSVDVQENSVNKLVLFYSSETELADSKTKAIVKGKPRVEFKYIKYAVCCDGSFESSTDRHTKKKAMFPENQFDLSKYVVKKEKGFELNLKYTGYKLNDYTK